VEALCLVLVEEVVAVLSVGKVAILAVMVGLSWTTGLVLFSVRIAVLVDVFVQAWGMVQVGAEV
jgi:Na+/pantothenate symporter